MILHLDPDSAVPPYEQLRLQVTTMIATGVLPVGTRLPSIRQLAGDLGLAVGTVARAYRELERAGAIAGKGRNGTFVLASPAQVPAAERDDRLAAAAQAFAVTARQLGTGSDQALRAAREALARVAGTPAGSLSGGGG